MVLFDLDKSSNLSINFMLWGSHIKKTHISKQTHMWEKKWKTLMQPNNAKSHSYNKFHVLSRLVGFSDTQVWKWNVLGFFVFCQKVICEHCSFWYNVVALLSIKVNKYFKKIAHCNPCFIKLNCCVLMGWKYKPCTPGLSLWLTARLSNEIRGSLTNQRSVGGLSVSAVRGCGSYLGMQESRRSVPWVSELVGRQRQR